LPDQPIATVLMSVYNGEKHLKESIKSILNQSFNEFTFLIINDGSTDRTAEILESFQKTDSRIFVIQNVSKKGLAASLNIGIRASKSKYIIRMDADDVAIHTRMESQINYMEGLPEIGVCGSWVRPIGYGKKRTWKYRTDDDGIKSNMVFGSPLCHPSVIIRRQVLEENGIFYNESLQATQDYWLWAELEPYTKFKNINKVLLKYRVYNNSVSNQSREQTINAGKIRLNFLKELKIAPSRREVTIHEKLGQLVFDFEKVELFEVYNWLMKLLKANELTQFVDNNAFKSTIVNIWFLACYFSPRAGWGGWKIYWKSDLSSLKEFNYYRTLKYFVKILIYRFKK